MQSRNIKKAAFIVLGIVLAVSLVVSVVLFGRKTAQGKDAGRGLVVSSDVSDWDKNLEDKSGDTPGIKIPGYGELTIDRNAEKFQMSLVNPEGNPCYFKYTLEIPETSEVLYNSDLRSEERRVGKEC